MVKRAIVALVLAASAVAVSAAPAQSIPPGDNLIVYAYYSDAAKTNLVGQQWWGCGNPSGSWGITTSYRTLYFTPC